MTRRQTFGHIFQRKGRPGFYIRLRIGDHEKLKYAGPDRRTAAEFAAKLLRAKAREELLGEKPIPSVPLADIMAELKEHLRGRHAAKTYAVEEQRLADIEAHFGPVPLRDVEPGDVSLFLSDLKAERDLSGATLNRYRALLSVLFNYAVDRGFARRNPVAGLPRDREALRPVRFLSDSDIGRLVVAAGDPDFRVFLRVLADTGLRRGEALALTWRDVDLPREEITVRRSKNNRPRTVPLTAAARDALAAQRDAAGVVPLAGEDPVWPALTRITPSSVSCRFATVVARAGLPAMRLHDLRHAFCSRLAQAGVPLSTIAELAGHRVIGTTFRYARHLPEDATRAAIRKLEVGGSAATSGTLGDPQGDPSKKRPRNAG